jgi:hypothetical protein
VPLLAALALLVAPHLRAPQAPTASAVESPLLRRIVVLGASLSHGYGLETSGQKMTFADVVEASLRAPHEPVRSKASLLFFTSPIPTGKAQVAAAVAEKPTLVVGVDFLFWYGYGFFASDDDRLSMLGKGLTELETFDCPILVGDFPDVSEASRSPSGDRPGLLAPEQVPSPSARRRLNDRLRAWATARKNVVVVPLADLVARRTSGEDLVIHGNRWPAATLASLVQHDRLHPTVEGTIAIWLGSLDALVAGRKDAAPSAFEWDAGAILRRLQAIAEGRAIRGTQDAKGADVGGGR